MDQVAGIRTGLPLPPAWEVAAQLLMYMLMEDYLGYWFHRIQHTKWFYNNVHYVHHEFKAPMGFVAAYAHWSESLIVGFASFVGMVIVPCHMTTCWLWFAIRGVVGVEIHCGYVHDEIVFYFFHGSKANSYRTKLDWNSKSGEIV